MADGEIFHMCSGYIELAEAVRFRYNKKHIIYQTSWADASSRNILSAVHCCEDDPTPPLPPRRPVILGELGITAENPGGGSKVPWWSNVVGGEERAECIDPADSCR